MTYQWSELAGSLVGGKYSLTEHLGEVSGDGVFSTDANGGPAILRLSPGENGEQLFERWTASLRLSHPSIIRMLDAGRAKLDRGEFIYTVTERPDDSLADAVRARALTADESREVVKSILEALAYLHQQGFVHGSIDPDNIVAVGDRIKLGPWSIRRGDQADVGNDIFATGQTIVEVLTQRRPASDTQADVSSLPPPFGHIARAAMQRRMTVAEALSALDAPEPATAHAPVRVRVGKAAIVAAGAGVLVLLLAVRAYRTDTPVQQAASVVTQAPPQTVRERVVEPAPQPQVKAAPSWVVVAAIYKDHGLAQKRADAIHRQWKAWNPEVYPPAGQSSTRRYMVVLDRANNRKEAERVLARARSAGMPSDVYVTKITP